MSILLLDDALAQQGGLFPREAGPLRIQGQHFYCGLNLQQNRCLSLFLLFLRQCRGEDITPELRFMRVFGFNTARVFGPLPWKETPDYRLEQFNFEQFYAFCMQLAAWGIRINFSVGHYPHAGWKTFDQRLDDVLRQTWHVVKERVNEPHVGAKPDPMLDFPSTTGRPVLTSFGYYKEALDGQPGHPPVLDYGTIHIPRDAAWHRKARIAQEVQAATGKPWWSDEPAKLTEPGFVYPGGKNDPEKTPAEIAWHAGVCYLWTSSFTFHCEEGKWGRVPQPGMLQYTCAESVRDHVFLKMGPEWQTGEYNHSGNHDSPVDDVDTPSGYPIWTYTSLHAKANKALSVRCALSEPQAKNGWTIVDRWGPANSFVRLER